MNRAEIRAEVRRKGMQDVPDIVIDGWIEDAYGDILAESNDWPFLVHDETVQVPAGQYSKGPENHRARVIKDVYLVNAGIEKPLGQMHPLDWAEYRAENPTGTPQHYKVEYLNNVLLVHITPTPTAPVNLRIRYVRDVDGLGTDSAQPAFPSRYHRLIVLAALTRAYEDVPSADNAETAKLVRADRDRRMKQMVDDFSVVSEDRAEIAYAPGTAGRIVQQLRAHPAIEDSTSVLLQDVAAAVAELCTRFRWPFLGRGPVPVTNDPAHLEYVAVPADYGGKASRLALEVRAGEPQELERLHADEITRSAELRWYAPGEPLFFSEVNADTSGVRRLRLYPAPSGVRNFLIEYEARPPAVTKVTDVLPWPVHFEHVAVAGALARAVRRSPDEKIRVTAGDYRADFERGIEQMRVSLLGSYARHDRIQQVADY